MDELHQEFFKKLKEKLPGLSNNDLRLCAYLKFEDLHPYLLQQLGTGQDFITMNGLIFEAKQVI